MKSHLGRETRCLRKKVQISCGKTQRNGFVNFKGHFVVVAGLSLVEDSVSSADLPGYWEFDTLLVGLDFDGFGKTAELSADAVEFAGGQRADRAKLSLGNAEILAVEIHEGEIELWDLLAT